MRPTCFRRLCRSSPANNWLTIYARASLTRWGLSTRSGRAAHWGLIPAGRGLNITTDSIARFGQLYLQQGEWAGQQLIPAAWIADATSYQTPNNGDNPDWQQGYGYQFWRCQHNAYRGDGAFGQYCIVMPAQDAVLAMTSGVGNMQAVLDQARTPLPAMAAQPLPADAAAQAALESRRRGCSCDGGGRGVFRISRTGFRSKLSL